MAIFKKRFINNIKDDIEIFQARWRQFLEFREKINFVKTVKEEKYQDGFLQDIFEKSLGFTLENTNPDDFNLIREEKNENDGKKADAVIKIDDEVIGVIELKDQKTKDLDKVEDQAFGYHSSHSNSKYIIISNFNEIRLYIDKRTSYEKFELFEMEYEDFVYFYKIMNFKSFQEDLPQKLKDDSIEFEKNISTIFYNDFSELRLELFYDISENNEIDKLEALELSQKILDRFIFILFAEDRYLLNPKISSEIIANWQNDWTERPLYFYIQMLFKGVNSGNARMGIPAYNGGLFSEDVVLDNLKISDSVLEKVVGLSSYDFQSDIDVNILGHIFEQSLDDLEKIRENISDNLDIQKAIRKKDGIFYTPQYITKYIIENSVGTLCKEKKSELGILKIEKLTAKMVKQLEKYRDFLKNLKILDPAVGSGAFLNEAFDFLKNEYIFISDSLSTYSIKKRNLFFSDDFDSLILENNLFGVDINKSAIEISKLSLWLKTAKRDRKLKNLSNNLLCANSLLDMPFEDGTFDVVVGNPPYVVKNLNEDEKIYFQKNYKSALYQINLYLLFMEKSLKMIKLNGISSMIVPNTWLVNKSIAGYRKELIDNYSISKIVDLTKIDVFVDATVLPIIFIMLKRNEKLEDIEILEYKNKIFKKKSRLNVSSILNNGNYLINYQINNNFNSILIKVESQFKTKISDIAKVSFGVKFYQKNKGVPKQTSEMVRNHIYTHNRKINKSCKLILEGKDINRYFFEEPCKYIEYGKNLAEPREEELFQGERILIRRILGRGLIATIITGDYCNNSLLHTLKVFDKKISSKFLLTIINSKFMGSYFKHKYARDEKVFPEIRIHELKNLLIPNLSTKDQQPFVQKANSLIVLNQKLNSAKQDFLSELELEKIPRKLQNFEKLELSEFIKYFSKLKKMKFKDKLAERKFKNEWKALFENDKDEVLQIQLEISRIENEIDNLVFKLYNLTDDEIKLISSE